MVKSAILSQYLQVGHLSFQRAQVKVAPLATDMRPLSLRAISSFSYRLLDQDSLPALLRAVIPARGQEIDYHR